MEIRRATQSDTKTVAALVLELMDELCSPKPSGYAAENLSDVATTLMDTGELAALIAEQNGEPVGVICLNGCASLYAGRFGEITELYVKPAFRSSGVGEDLVGAACELAREKSWSRLEVGTPEQPVWARTLAFYVRNRFIETGTRLKLPL